MAIQPVSTARVQQDDSTAQEVQVDDLKAAIAALTEENRLLRHQMEIIKEQVRLANLRAFGPSSEHSVPYLPNLFDEAEAIGAAVEQAIAAGEEVEPEPSPETLVRLEVKVGKTRAGRVVPVADLAVEEIVYELSESQRQCAHCQHELHPMGEEVREELKIIPARCVRVRHKRVKYACRHCAQHEVARAPITAPMPTPAFPGSMASPSAVAHIMSQKVELSVPLYRQAQHFSGRGLELSRQTLSNWILRGSVLLEPLYKEMRAQLIKREILHADETVVQVLHEPGREAQSQSRMWVYCAGNESGGGDQEPAAPPLVLYEYASGRGSEHPLRFLQGFSGYLHVDGYEAYEKLATVPGTNGGGVTLVGCWAHARRKFDEAVKILPKEAGRDKNSPAHRGLDFCNRLYAIEREVRQASAEERGAVRGEKSAALLAEFRIWLQAQATTVIPKSQLGKAVGYCLSQWSKLTTFLQDGRLEIDNNRCERAVKPFVIGRKNWLFANTPAGARSSAVIYSVVETAKENNLVPSVYLQYLLEQLPTLELKSGVVKDQAALEALLPWSPQVQAICSKAAIKATK